VFSLAVLNQMGSGLRTLKDGVWISFQSLGIVAYEMDAFHHCDEGLRVMGRHHCLFRIGLQQALHLGYGRCVDRDLGQKGLFDTKSLLREEEKHV
jgi:hypothetical protein